MGGGSRPAAGAAAPFFRGGRGGNYSFDDEYNMMPGRPTYGDMAGAGGASPEQASAADAAMRQATQRASETKRSHTDNCKRLLNRPDNSATVTPLTGRDNMVESVSEEE